MEQIINVNDLHFFLFWVFAAYAGVLVSMLVDLLAAYFKCKKCGIKWESNTLKRTADKANKYFLPMIALTLIDCLIFIVNKYPVFTLALGGFCILSEWFSVFEHTHTKQEQREAAKTINVILKNKCDVTSTFREILNDYYHDNK